MDRLQLSIEAARFMVADDSLLFGLLCLVFGLGLMIGAIVGGLFVGSRLRRMVGEIARAVENATRGTR